MSTREDLLNEIETFLTDTGMSATRFGDEAINDRALVMRLRAGRDLKLATVDKIRAFMAKQRAGDGRKPRSKSTPAQAAA